MLDMNTHHSTVIIGGGLGGLFTGAILAKNGIHVTVIEKNATLGGGLQTFSRFGERFDTGMHVVAGLQEGGNIRRLCDYLGVYDEAMFKAVDEHRADAIYVAADDRTYYIGAGREKYIQSLTEYFPEQKQNILNYVQALYEVVEELPLYHLRPNNDDIFHSDNFLMSAEDFIAKYISDPKLQGLIAYINMLYSGETKTPAFVHAVISVMYLSGPCRFVGGSQQLADKLAKVITENGGSVVLNDGVKRIHSQNKEITSVETNNGLRFEAEHYISAIHPKQMLHLLEDENVLPKIYRERLKSIPDTYSAFTINIKFKEGKFPFLNHTGFYLEDYDVTWQLGNESADWPLGFLYMTPPEKDQGECCRTMIITVPISWETVKDWEDSVFGQRPEAYRQWKEDCLEKVLAKIEKIFPNIRAQIEAINTASPLTIRDFYGTCHGAMSGFSKDCSNIAFSQLSVKTKIHNLLLTGQNVSLHGFCGVPLTAIRTSEAILGINSILNKL